MTDYSDIGVIMHPELLQSIRQAFPDDGVPSRPVTPHRCLECNEVDVLLGGRTWSDVAADFPGYCHDAFPLLTQAAQIYYLPAYMIAAFAADSGIQGDSVESALLSADLPTAAFSVPQRGVIWTWLKAWFHQGGQDVPSELALRWSSNDGNELPTC